MEHTYHLHAKTVTRSKSQSVVAKAAYNARVLLINENTGSTHDYRSKGRTLFSCFLMPKDAPEWVQKLARKRQSFWSVIEATEKRRDSQFAREIEISLPFELTEQQQEFLVKDFVIKCLVQLGMIADVSLHKPSREGNMRNFHAHILLTMRSIGQECFGQKVREWNGKKQLRELRAQWAIFANQCLERYGHEKRIDHRSFKDRGIDREPTIHLGKTSTYFERKGLPTERGNKNREIKKRNQRLEELKIEKKALLAEIEAVQRQIDNEIKKKQRKGTHVRPLMVIERNPGKPKVEMKLTEFIQTLSEKPIPRQFTRDEILNSHTKQRERYSQIIAERDHKRALESIRLDIEKNVSLKADNIRKLSRDDIEGIRANGDDYLRNRIKQYEIELDDELEL